FPLPPNSNPPSKAKTPTRTVPKKPHTPCTETAPTGSSIFILLSMKPMERTTMIPQIRPMAKAPQVFTAPHPAVIPTRPAEAPFKLMEISAFPYLNQEKKSAPMAPQAPARLVLMITLPTAMVSSPPQANWEPPLKPNQPIQRISTPRAPKAILCPGITWGFPSTYFPIRGPTKKAATRAAVPPTAWTTEDPAKSTKPASLNQAFSSKGQYQLPEIG